jgi:hypothetical protein
MKVAPVIAVAVRSALGLCGGAFVIFQAMTQSRTRAGNLYLDLVDQGGTRQDARIAAERVWDLSLVLAVLIPLALGVALAACWRPRSRLSYSLRFSLWPLIVLSGYLGASIASAIVCRTPIVSIDQVVFLAAVILIGSITGILWFGIGYAIHSASSSGK